MSVALHYAAAPPAAPNPLTLHEKVVNNCVVFANVPRNAATFPTMTWYAANGALVPH